MTVGGTRARHDQAMDEYLMTPQQEREALEQLREKLLDVALAHSQQLWLEGNALLAECRETIQRLIMSTIARG